MMEADWEVEIGGEDGDSAPIIDALWPGFIDLRRFPDRVAEITEAAGFPRALQVAHRIKWRRIDPVDCKV